MLVYIENKEILAQVLSYLDLADIKYTTNVKENYRLVLITDINNKILKIIKNKKVILLTDYIEDKILNNKLSVPIENNFKVITSLPILKNKSNIFYIPKIIPKINLKKNKLILTDYNLSKTKKKIIVFDKNIKYLDELEKLVDEYSDYEFIYIGYRNLKKQERIKIDNLNIIWIKFINLVRYNDLCNFSNIVIIFDSDIKMDYIYISILTHTEIFMVEDNIYNNYFVPSKQYYSFSNLDNLKIKLNKFLISRISSLNDNAYFLIEKNTENNYLQTLKKIIK